MCTCIPKHSGRDKESSQWRHSMQKHGAVWIALLAAGFYNNVYLLLQFCFHSTLSRQKQHRKILSVYTFLTIFFVLQCENVVIGREPHTNGAWVPKLKAQKYNNNNNQPWLCICIKWPYTLCNRYEQKHMHYSGMNVCGHVHIDNKNAIFAQFFFWK